MKFLFLILLTLPVFASRINDDIKSYGQRGDEISVRFSSHDRVMRMPANSRNEACLRNAWLSKKPVSVEVNDQTGKIVDCDLAPRQHPGRAGK